MTDMEGDMDEVRVEPDAEREPRELFTAGGESRIVWMTRCCEGGFFGESHDCRKAATSSAAPESNVYDDPARWGERFDAAPEALLDRLERFSHRAEVNGKIDAKVFRDALATLRDEAATPSAAPEPRQAPCDERQLAAAFEKGVRAHQEAIEARAARLASAAPELDVAQAAAAKWNEALATRDQQKAWQAGNEMMLAIARLVKT